MQKLTFFNYKISNDANKVCDIYIDGIIVDASTQEIYERWFDDTTPTSFKSMRNQIAKDTKTVNVYINSGGGQVTEAMAIHDYLVQLQSNGIEVNTFGRGLVASAATYILMASKNSTISANSWFMIHNVAGAVWGDVNTVENYAKTLRNFNDTVVRFYSNATGLSESEVGEFMNAETWFNGTQAHEKKFVKKLEAEQNFTNTIAQSQWVFNNTEVLHAYNSFIHKNNLNEMDIKQLINDALQKAGLITDKNKTEMNTLAETIANALKEPLDNEVDTKIKNAIDGLPKPMTAEELTNAVTEAVKNLKLTEGLATEKSVTDLKTELDTVKEGIAENKGTEGKQKQKNEGNPEKMKGVEWQN